MILHEVKREEKAFKAEIDDKLDNTEEHDDYNEDISDEYAENTDARNANKEQEIEIDNANGVTKVNDEENEKNDVFNAKTNAEDNEVENDKRNDSIEVDD